MPGYRTILYDVADSICTIMCNITTYSNQLHLTH